MTHEDAREVLLELAYGELAPDAARELSRHVAACDACSAELDRIAAVRAVASRLGDGPGPAAHRDELVRAARVAVAVRPARRWFTRPATLSFAAAAAVVAIVGGVTLKLTSDDLGRVGSGASPGELRPVTPEVAESPQRSEPREQRGQRIPAPPAPARAAIPAPAPSAPASSRDAPAERGRSMAAAPAAAPARKAAPAASDRGADRRSEGGGLVEERRTLRCGAAVVERVALVAPGGRVVRLTERREGAVVEGWYDEDGRLRPLRQSDAYAGGTSEDAASAGRATARVLPETAPTLEQLATSCAW